MIVLHYMYYISNKYSNSEIHYHSSHYHWHGKMSKRVERNLAALQALAKANRAVQKSMISHGSKDFILSLVECASNIIRGNVRLSPAQLRDLQPFEKHLRKFIQKKTSQKQRKSILQRGGFLGAIIKPLLGLLGLG